MWETWVWKIPWRRESLLPPVFWPGEFHGLYSPWGRKEDWVSFTFTFHFQERQEDGDRAPTLCMDTSLREQMDGAEKCWTLCFWVYSLRDVAGKMGKNPRSSKNHTSVCLVSVSTEFWSRLLSEWLYDNFREKEVKLTILKNQSRKLHTPL